MIAGYTKGTNDAAYSDERWPQYVRLAKKFARLLEARPPARILDLACGTGVVTTALALRGFEMTGIDCTPAMLDVARRMSKQKGAAVTWVCADMREFSYVDEFDCVLLWDVIFGVFEKEGEDEDLIARIARALKPGGRCLFEVYNKEFALAHGVENRYFYDEISGRFVSRGPEPAWNSLRLYAHNEWERMLRAHGLEIVKMDGWNWRGDPMPPPWRADYIVAQKRLE